MKMFAFAVALALVLLSTSSAEARWGRRGGYSTTTTAQYSSPVQGDTSTAQGVAEIMARVGYVGHFGGYGNCYEGCGMSGTKESAYAICCYANSGMRTVDVGYAQGANGYWYCCRRYSN